MPGAMSRYKPWIQVGHVSLGSYKLHDVGDEFCHLSLPQVVSTSFPMVVDIVDLTEVLDQTFVCCLQGLGGGGGGEIGEGGREGGRKEGREKIKEGERVRERGREEGIKGRGFSESAAAN